MSAPKRAESELKGDLRDFLSGAGFASVRYVERREKPAPPPQRCPRCGVKPAVSLGDAHSSLQWFCCEKCHHVWAIDPALPEITMKARSA
jgi:hypothetical protein